MNSSRILFFIISAICIFVSNDAAPISKYQPKLIIRGRVIYPGGSKIPIEPGAQLTVELQDTSLADAPAKVIAKGTGKAVRFPMAFAIKYLPSQLGSGVSYSLRVTIKNKKNELLYTNDVHTGVVPLGANRTKFVDVPVILVKKTPVPVDNKRQWPELVGMKGEDAVKRIKKETGFTNVMTVKIGSPVTMDYRMDRVRVFVDGKGIVKNPPSVG